ncbi:MAG: hypothetical protein V4608_10290 [Bacteroidota bacterium]
MGIKSVFSSVLVVYTNTDAPLTVIIPPIISFAAIDKDLAAFSFANIFHLGAVDGVVFYSNVSYFECKQN